MKSKGETVVRVRILGTRGNIEAFAPRHMKHSGVLIDDCLLLDVGEKEFLNYRPRCIFITHLHPDHAALIEAKDIRINTPVYAPEIWRILPGVQVVSKPVVVGLYTVTPVPTVHSQHVKSVGYIIQKGKQKLFYSSDMIRIESKYHRLLRGLDLVITEGSFIRSKGLIRLDARTREPFGHNGIPDLVKFFSGFTHCIIVTHFGTWYFRDIPKSRRKIESLSNGVRVIPAYDGMFLDVGTANTSKVRDALS
jgi:ribonuclease BN (tRNA processing enzyme)